MLTGLTVAVFSLLLQARPAPPASADLAAAKALYASGAYEEALSRLPSTTEAGSAADEANQYRALCALALGRTAEAERSLEELIIRRPMFKMSDAEVSPRLVTMFHDVRKRVLPAVVRTMYGAARTSFEQKRYEAASAQLKDLTAVLNDSDLASQAGTLADLKLLAEGFQKLADAEIAAALKAQPPAPPAPAAAAPAPPAPVRIYTEEDKDVAAPVEIRRNFPPWKPSGPLADKFKYSGVLRVVIDEKGKVESAGIMRSISDAYDALLLTAARDWLFRPATRNGQPVKYQKLIAITLTPR